MISQKYGGYINRCYTDSRLFGIYLIQTQKSKLYELYLDARRERTRRRRGGQDRQNRKREGHFEDQGSILGASNHGTKEKTGSGPTIHPKNPQPSDRQTG